MSSLFLLLASLFSHADPVPVAVLTQQMHFTYQPNEGEEATQCQHSQISDLPDWAVTCSTNFGTKSFTAHVIVREYPKNATTGVEILYWVSEPGVKPTFHSTSALLNLSGSTSLSDFSLSQGVENDYASLVLGWSNVH